MKRKWIIILMVLMLSVLSCGQKKKGSEESLVKEESTQEEISQNEEKKAEDNNENEAGKGKRDGNNEVGFVTLPENWERAHSQSGEAEVLIFSNSEKDEEYITLLRNNTGLDAEAMVKYAYEKLTRKEEDAKNVKEIEETVLNGMKAYRIVAEYPQETVIKNYIDYNGKGYMVEAAGPSDSVEILLNILDKTWSPEK